MANPTEDIIAFVLNVGRTNNNGKPVPAYMNAMITALSTKLVDHNDMKIGELKVKHANDLQIRDDKIFDLQKTVTDRDTTISNLQKDNKEMLYQQDALSQYNRRDSIKLFGIPHNQTENINDIVKDVAKHLGVDLEDKDISIAHRLFTRDQRNETSHSSTDRQNKPPPAIIAKLALRNKKNQIYEAKKKLRITKFPKYPNLAIYEDITPLRNRILYKLRNKKDQLDNKVYKFTWTRDGRIYWRTDAESRMDPQPKPHAVNRPDDLKDLGFSEEEIYKIVYNLKD